jgi:hypothetical protein
MPLFAARPVGVEVGGKVLPVALPRPLSAVLVSALISGPLSPRGNSATTMAAHERLCTRRAPPAGRRSAGPG